MSERTCGVVEDGTPCPKPPRKRGWCEKHYCRWLKHGDPAVTVARPAGELKALLLRAIETQTDECVILPPKTRRPTVYLNGKGMNASRAVWLLAKGDPGRAFVLHSCHRGADGCINLRHLYLGDQARNIADMHQAGRANIGDRAGEANGRHKLTAEQAEEIRRRYRAGGVRQVDLADEYGVSRTVVGYVTRGESWVPDGETRRPRGGRRRRASPETVAAIRRRWKRGGISQQALADEYGIDQTTVSRIVRKR